VNYHLFDPARGQKPHHFLGLRRGSGISVEDKPILTIGPSDSLCDQSVYEFVGHQSSGPHPRFNGTPDCRAPPDVIAEHIAR
jgi:hypothetical protein